MRIGIYSVLYQNYPFELALDKIAEAGATAVEIGTGELSGGHHCPIDELLESESKRKVYLKAVKTRGLIISAFSSHWDPLSPDKKLANDSNDLFRKTVRLAEMIGVVLKDAVIREAPARCTGHKTY